MAIDISKVFRANVKAIRMHLSDGTDKSDILNEELLNTKKKKAETAAKNDHSFVKEATQIVKFLPSFLPIIQNCISSFFI